MRPWIFSFTFCLLLSSILTGCSAGNATPPSAPLAITGTGQLLPGVVNTAYDNSAGILFEATGGTPPYTWSVIAGALPKGMTLSASGLLNGVPTVAGTSSFTLQVADSESTPQKATLAATLVISDGTVSITSPSLPQGTINTAYSATFAATGGTPPYTWSIVTGTLPAGLTLSSNGTISGTPTTVGSSTILVKATDSASTPQSGTGTYSLNISGGPLAITTTSLPLGAQGQPYSVQLAGSGGIPPYTWSLAGGIVLPNGLTLSVSGHLSGTPTAEGKTTLVVYMGDSSGGTGTASATLNLVIGGSSLLITTFSLPAAQQNTAYSYQLTALGGTPPYTWSVDPSTPLPSGLTLSPTGVLSGTPTGLSNTNPNFTVTDSASNTISEAFNLIVNPASGTIPDGTYAFVFSGLSSKEPAGGTTGFGGDILNGIFTLKSGTVVSGFYDENYNLNGDGAYNHGTDGFIELPLSGGTLTVGADGIGQLTLDYDGGPLITMTLAAPASVAPGQDTAIRLAAGPNSGAGGVLKLCKPNTTSSAIQGNYTFLFSGFDFNQNPAALAASFHTDGAGNITTGSSDFNGNGTLQNFSTLSGTYAVDNNGHGTLQFTLGATTLHYSFYEVSPSEWLAISLDPITSNTPLAAGVVLQQTGSPFSGASLPSTSVLQMNGLKVIGVGNTIPDITAGIGTSDRNSNLTLNYDEYVQTLSTGQSLALTYTVDAGTGRVATTASSGAAPILYLIDGTRAFVLGTDTSASSGILEQQSTLPFTSASFKGNYLGGSLPLLTVSTVNETGLVAADGNGNVLITTQPATNMYQNIAGTYAVDSHGRVVVTVPGDSTPRIFYVVSPTKVGYLTGDGGGYLGSFEQ
jgi:hypothetical protein